MNEDLDLSPSEERHQRKCAVCNHPDRREIEEEFLEWRETWQIARDYELPDHRSIYRHARAYGLIDLRRENRRAMLDRILESGPAKVTGDTIIRALKAYSCLTKDNRWVEPSKRTEVTVSRAEHSTPKSLPAEDQKRLSAPAEDQTEDQTEDQNEDQKKLAAPAEPLKEALPLPALITHAGMPPEPLPEWDGRFESTFGSPNR